jgi:prolyl-tRNA synthetase
LAEQSIFPVVSELSESSAMSSQKGKDLVEPAATSQQPQTMTLPDRTLNPAADGDAQGGEISKNALKKAAKKEKKGIGKSESKHQTAKTSKKKIEGAALIGIDIAKEDDFAAWYQQVLLKGEMLDYYDVSGCFILKVYILFPPHSVWPCAWVCRC